MAHPPAVLAPLGLLLLCLGFGPSACVPEEAEETPTPHLVEPDSQSGGSDSGSGGHAGATPALDHEETCDCERVNCSPPRENAERICDDLGPEDGAFLTDYADCPYRALNQLFHHGGATYYYDDAGTLVGYRWADAFQGATWSCGNVQPCPEAPPPQQCAVCLGWEDDTTPPCDTSL